MNPAPIKDECSLILDMQMVLSHVLQCRKAERLMAQEQDKISYDQTFHRTRLSSPVNLCFPFDT